MDKPISLALLVPSSKAHAYSHQLGDFLLDLDLTQERYAARWCTSHTSENHYRSLNVLN